MAELLVQPAKAGQVLEIFQKRNANKVILFTYLSTGEHVKL